jgi:hypothetical protein
LVWRYAGHGFVAVPVLRQALARRSRTTRASRRSRTDSYFARTYGISGDVYELTVTADSPLVGMSIGEAEAQPRYAPLILALRTGNESRLAPPADEMIWVGSTLGVMGEREAIVQSLRPDPDEPALCMSRHALLQRAVQPEPRRHLRSRRAAQFALHRPDLLGDLRLRKQLGISVLAVISRQPGVPRGLAQAEHSRRRSAGVSQHLERSGSGRGESAISSWSPTIRKDEQRPHKLWYRAGRVRRSRWIWRCPHEVAVPVALMAGVVGMLLTGVLNMDEAYAAVNWKTVFVMASLIPLGWAVDSSGLASEVANWLMQRRQPAAGVAAADGHRR